MQLCECLCCRLATIITEWGESQAPSTQNSYWFLFFLSESIQPLSKGCRGVGVHLALCSDFYCNAEISPLLENKGSSTVSVPGCGL